MKMGLCPNGKVKEKVFSHFYKGTSYQQFKWWGRRFADVAETMLNRQVVETLRQHLAARHTVCVVTASIDEWVRPVCERLGVGTLLATRVEIAADGTLTGRFLSPNCHGAQKVARLLEAFPQRETYMLYAYGDSRGDNELLAFADKGFRIGHIYETAQPPCTLYGGCAVFDVFPYHIGFHLHPYKMRSMLKKT